MSVLKYLNNTMTCCRYLHVTLGKYPAHMVEPYNSAQEKAKVGCMTSAV